MNEPPGDGAASARGAPAGAGRKVFAADGPLVVGLGNPLRGDDGVGAAVARRVAGAGRPGLRVLVHAGEPTDLIESWRGRTCAVVVDAMRSGAPAGTVRRFEASAAPLPASAFPLSLSSHLLPLPDVIELARALGALPQRLLVVGVEGGAFALGTGLSPAVAACVERLADEVLAETGRATSP